MGQVRACLPYDAVVCLRQACFFFGGADFFFAKRLFFRYGEGCEGRASRATVGVTAKDNGGACFPLDFGITPTKGRQPSHPHRSGFFCSFHATCVPICEWLATTDPPRLIALTSLPPTFIHFHPSKATIPPQKRNIPYWYCLQCTPSLILPPSSLISWQKSNSNIHSGCFKCFKCFGCFRCFISLLDHKTARFWSKSEQNRCFKCYKPAAPNQAANPQKRYFTV